MSGVVEVAEDVAGGAVKAATGGLSAFLGGWQMILGAAVISAALAGYGSWTVCSWKNAGTIESLKSAVKSAGDKVVIANGNTQGAWDAYGRLKVSLDNLKADSDARAARADAELAKLKGDKAVLNASIDKLLASKPPAGMTDLQAIDALIREYLK